LKGSAVTLHLNVPDVDKWVKRAVKAGATVTMPVSDMFWGDRYGIVTDPFGHSWSMATHKKNMTVAEIQQAMKKMAPP
ncbi:VOC family protein, partial [Microbacteriaceae bacterium K1510]|nr:VOC family protein [Microbacteriaceae bacterium K1510]